MCTLLGLLHIYNKEKITLVVQIQIKTIKKSSGAEIIFNTELPLFEQKKIVRVLAASQKFNRPGTGNKYLFEVIPRMTSFQTIFSDF